MSSTWTRAELIDLLAEWKAAYKAASSGKAYTTSTGRTLTRQDVPTIRAEIAYLQGELDSLQSGARPRGIVRAVVVR